MSLSPETQLGYTRGLRIEPANRIIFRSELIDFYTRRAYVYRKSRSNVRVGYAETAVAVSRGGH